MNYFYKQNSTVNIWQGHNYAFIMHALGRSWKQLLGAIIVIN